MATSLHRSIAASVTALLIGCLAPAFAKTPPQPSAAEHVKELAALLKSGAPQKEKADACRELARIGTRDAVAPLAALLADEKLSHMARYGLETIPGSAPDKALRAALGKLHGRPLVGVIGSIGARRDSQAVKPLIKLLRDPNPEVAQAAARALGKIGNSAAARGLQTTLSTLPEASQLAFCEALLRCAESLAAKGTPREAIAIYDRLRALPAPHQVRTAAFRGAVLTRQQDGLPLLLQTLSSDDPALFAAAIRVAQELPGTEVTAALAIQLKWLPVEKQIPLIQTLGKRADAAALPALFAAAKKGGKSARVTAIQALPEIGHASAVPVLVELLDDADREIARVAQEGLAGLPGKEADSAVLAMIARGKPERRITAMELIVRRRMLSASPQLFAAAEDFEPKIRLAAVKKLGEMMAPSEMPALLGLLDKAKSPEDLEAAEQALSAVSLRATDAEACALKLAGAFAQARPAKKCALLRVLTALGGTNALKVVRTAINVHESEVRVAAVRALCSWNSTDAAPDLLDLARVGVGSSDQTLCLRGYLRLAAQPDLAAAKRLAMCRDAGGIVQKEDEKKLLLAVLGGVHSLDALALIQPYLDDPVTKEEAGTAVVTLAEKLLQGDAAANLAPKLIEPLDKVAQATANADLAKRAKTLLEQARKKIAHD